MKTQQRFVRHSQGALFRPTRVAVIHGSTIDGTRLTHAEINECLDAVMRKLRVDIFPVAEANEKTNNRSFDPEDYDLVILVGEPDEFNALTRNYSNAASLSFAPRWYFSKARSYLRSSDALILCEAKSGNWLPEVSRLIYKFLENLTIPGLLNVDIADIRRIAKGVGTVLTYSDYDFKRLESLLPKESLAAKSAILHFSCTDDVTLNEIYSISKSIIASKATDCKEYMILSRAEAKRIVRKVNVKLGIRMIDHSKHSGTSGVRISLMVILFGF